MKTETFHLGNLCCVSCANDIKRALRANPHVHTASVDYRQDTATVTYYDDRIAPKAVARIIESAGHGCSQVSPVAPLHDYPAVHETDARTPATGGSQTTNMAHLQHQTQMAPISMGTKMDRMQYEMLATQAEHVHQQMRQSSSGAAALDQTAMGRMPADHKGMGQHMGMAHDMSDPKMARAMEPTCAPASSSPWRLLSPRYSTRPSLPSSSASDFLPL